MHSRGASTWSLRTADHFATYEATAAADASSIWAVGAPGGILHSTDAGANWTLQTRGPLLRAISVSAIGASTAWAAGFGGTIVRTADAGTTWTLVRDESAFITFTGDRIYDVGRVFASVATV